MKCHENVLDPVAAARGWGGARPSLFGWIVACTVAELVGFAGAALWAWLALSLFGNEPASAAARLGVLALMVLAGVCEGALLGALQWLALRRWFDTLPARGWIAATGTVAALGWLLGMLPSTLIGGPSEGAAVEPPLSLVLLGAALFGGLAGALFGWAQWLVLRAHARPARRWIVANAAGWALGLPWSYLAGSLADVSASLAWAVSCGVLAGALMGLSVALATAYALARLEPMAERAGRELNR
jgi:hypothetical protein